jgi:hypothetical protein
MALIDVPAGDVDLAQRMEDIFLGTDVSLCGWAGAEGPFKSHAWRSAATALSSLVSVDGGNVHLGLEGRAISIGPGRSVASDRRQKLRLGHPEQFDVGGIPSSSISQISAFVRRVDRPCGPPVESRTPHSGASSVVWPAPTLAVDLAIITPVRRGPSEPHRNPRAR